MDGLITIASFYNQMDYELLKSKLISEGIEVFGKDEYTHQSANYLWPMTGGIKMQVRMSQYTEAFEILKACGYLKDEDLLPDVEIVPVAQQGKANRFTKILIGTILLLVLALIVSVVFFRS